jgi:hypothetical protein
LIEGTAERLLLPVILRNLEKAEAEMPKLSSQYMTTMEVGGAYAHIFFELLDFLELRSLIITDIDTVTVAGGTACPVSGADMVGVRPQLVVSEALLRQLELCFRHSLGNMQHQVTN